MAKVTTNVDDILYRLNNQKVEATDTASVSVPGAAFGGTRAKSFKLDVSPQGQRKLDQLLRAAEAKTVEAWSEVIKACGTTPEAILASTPAGRKTDDDTPARNDADAADDSEASH